MVASPRADELPTALVTKVTSPPPRLALRASPPLAALADARGGGRRAAALVCAKDASRGSHKAIMMMGRMSGLHHDGALSVEALFW